MSMWTLAVMGVERVDRVMAPRISESGVCMMEACSEDGIFWKIEVL